jgi:dihydroflavonol-4-reductase
MLTLEEITGVAAPRFKMPIWLAQIIATFTPLYYSLTNTKPRFTRYSIRTLTGNSVISHEKAVRELGYSPRPIRESIVDAIQWFKETGKL